MTINNATDAAPVMAAAAMLADLCPDITAKKLVAAIKAYDPADEKLLTARDAAKRLGVTPAMVYKCVKAGLLRAARIGKAVRITAADLNAFAGMEVC